MALQALQTQEAEDIAPHSHLESAFPFMSPLSVDINIPCQVTLTSFFTPPLLGLQVFSLALGAAAHSPEGETGAWGVQTR